MITLPGYLDVNLPWIVGPSMEVKEWIWDHFICYLCQSATYHDDEKMYPEDPKKIGIDGPIPMAYSELTPEMQSFRDSLTKAWKSMGQSMTCNAFDGDLDDLTPLSIPFTNSIYLLFPSVLFPCNIFKCFFIAK